VRWLISSYAAPVKINLSMADVRTAQRPTRTVAATGKRPLTVGMITAPSTPMAASARHLRSFGKRIAARDLDRQTAETHIRIALGFNRLCSQNDSTTNLTLSKL